MHDYAEVLSELGAARKEICRPCPCQAESIVRITRLNLRNYAEISEIMQESQKLWGMRVIMRSDLLHS